MLYFYILIAIQIVVESLPISSSSHVQLLERGMCVLPLSSSVLYALHIPTTVILACFFFRQWFFMLTHVRACVPIIGKLLVLGFIVDGITALFFVALHYVPVTIPLGVGLCITAVCLYSLRVCPVRTQKFGYYQAVVVGIAQGVALLPGISRFALVYTTARWLGINHRRAFEITWLVEFPLIIAAAMGSAYLDHGQALYSLLSDPIAWVVIVVASIAAYMALYLMERLAAYGYLWIISFYMIMPLVWWLYRTLFN